MAGRASRENPEKAWFLRALGCGSGCLCPGLRMAWQCQVRLRGPEHSHSVCSLSNCSMFSLKVLGSHLRVRRRNPCANFPGYPRILCSAAERTYPILQCKPGTQGSSLFGGMSCAEAPLCSPSGPRAFSPEASSQLISGSQVGIQVTPVSGAVTPQ